MKTETLEEFKARGGKINYIPGGGVDAPVQKDKKLKTKLIAMNWPNEIVVRAKRKSLDK